MRGRAVPILLALAGALLGATGAGASAAETPTPVTTPGPEPTPVQGAPDEPEPALGVVGPESIVFEIRSPGRGTAADARGSAHVLVANSGGTDVDVRIAAVLLDDPPGDCSAEVVPVDDVTVPARSAARVSVALTATQGCADETGTLVLTTEPPSAPVVARFAFARTDFDFRYVLPAWGAGIAAVVLGVSLRPGKVPRRPIYLGPAFSFTSSWLTTVSAFTAGLGAVFTTTGVTSSLLPGVDANKLLTLNLVFGALVLAAPLAYAALSRWTWKEEGATKKYEHRTTASRAALVVASCTTVAGVVGQLGTVGILVYEADVADSVQYVLALALVAVGAAVFLYAYRWTGSALRRPDDPVADAEPSLSVREVDERTFILVHPPSSGAPSHIESGTL